MAYNHQLVWSRNGNHKSNQHSHRMGSLPHIHSNTVQDKRRVATAPKAPIKHDPSHTSPNGSPTHTPKFPLIRFPRTGHSPSQLSGSLRFLHSRRFESNLHENLNLRGTPTTLYLRRKPRIKSPLTVF